MPYIEGFPVALPVESPTLDVQAQQVPGPEQDAHLLPATSGDAVSMDPAIETAGHRHNGLRWGAAAVAASLVVVIAVGTTGAEGDSWDKPQSSSAGKTSGAKKATSKSNKDAVAKSDVTPKDFPDCTGFNIDNSGGHVSVKPEIGGSIPAGTGTKTNAEFGHTSLYQPGTSRFAIGSVAAGTRVKVSVWMNGDKQKCGTKAVPAP